ncbi:MAG: trypsin-like peptidase domain-containing protein [Actinomycetota bacterium]|nr:trypsin-like peptidase domain-containing protein [Actinomycetota bacterium]
MNRMETSLGSPFASAVVGGVAALALAIGVVASGLVDVDNTDDGTTTVAAARTVTDSQPASGSSRTVGQVYEEDGQGVAFIESTIDQPAEATPFGPPGSGGTATGSGFLIDDAGHLLTNAHVVDGASTVSVTFGDGETLDATVLGADDSTDIAVLEVDPSAVSATPLELGDSSAVEVGDPAVAIGNPYGLDRTVTSGIISALQRQISAPNGFTISNVLQTDAAINPGNSGGPLIDFQGRVIGVNSQIATGGSSTGSVGIGFAVPIETARNAAEQIIDGGSVEHAYLGIAGADLDEELAAALGLDVTEGALIQDVTPDGPAEDAGLRAGDQTASVDGGPVRAGGDVITAIDGEPIASMDDVIAAIDSHRPGEEVTIDVIRDGEPEQLTVRLGDRPSSALS